MIDRRAILPAYTMTLLMSVSFYILMPVLGQQLINTHGLNIGQVTWLLSLRIIVQDLCMAAGGTFDRHLGSRNSIALAALLRGTGFLLYSTSSFFPVLCVASILSGVGGSLFFPAILAYYTRHSKAEDMSSVLSAKSTLDALGSIVGPLLGAVFVAASFFTVSLAAALIFYLCAGIALLFMPKDTVVVIPGQVRSATSLKTVLMDRTFLSSSGIVVLMMFFINNLTIAITAKINEINPAYAYIGYISLVGSMVLVLFQVKVYKFISSLFPVRSILLFAAVLFAIGYLIMGLSHAVWGVYLAAIVISAGTLLYSPTRELLLVQQGKGQDVALYYGALGLIQSTVNLAFTPVMGFLFGLSEKENTRMAVWIFFVLLALTVIVLEKHFPKGGTAD